MDTTTTAEANYAVTERAFFNEHGTDGYSIYTDIYTGFGFGIDGLNDGDVIADLEVEILWCGNRIYLDEEAIEQFEDIFAKAKAAHAKAKEKADELNAKGKEESSVQE